MARRPGWDVKQAREAAGLKPVALSRQLGLPDKTISRLERCIKPMPSVPAATALIAALTIPSTQAKDDLLALRRRHH